MKGWIRKTCMGCVVAASLAAPVAHADGGTIRFVGAIVAPTCGDASEGLHDDARGGCGAAMANVASRSSMYRQSTVSLEDAMQQRDRLLAYFATYADAGDAHLVMRTYD
jgi:type 1 fimbria pilin